MRRNIKKNLVISDDNFFSVLDKLILIWPKYIFLESTSALCYGLTKRNKKLKSKDFLPSHPWNFPLKLRFKTEMKEDSTVSPHVLNAGTPEDQRFVVCLSVGHFKSKHFRLLTFKFYITFLLGPLFYKRNILFTESINQFQNYESSIHTDCFDKNKIKMYKYRLDLQKVLN